MHIKKLLTIFGGLLNLNVIIFKNNDGVLYEITFRLNKRHGS